MKFRFRVTGKIEAKDLFEAAKMVTEHMSKLDPDHLLWEVSGEEVGDCKP